MRLSFLLAIFGLVARVFGDTTATLANQYAIVAYWYAYVLEHEAEGTDPKLIAPGCTVVGESPICYFDEFCRYIQRNLPGDIPMGTGEITGIGENLKPVPSKAVFALISMGYSGAVDSSKLLPGKFSSVTNAAFSEVMSGINDVVSGARKTAATAGKAVDDIVDSFSKTVNSVSNFMMEDLGGAHITAFANWCTAKACKFSIYFKTILNPDGTSYNVVDIDDMIEKYNGDIQDILDGVSDFLKDFTPEGIWPTTPDGPPATEDRVALSRVQSAQQGLSLAIEAPHC